MNDMIRAIRFERPERIPMGFAINDACWNHYDHSALQDLMEAHSYLFPDFERKPEPVEITPLPFAIAGEPYTDSFGCVWTTTETGIAGSVNGHPLADWAALDSYQPPDPDTCDGRVACDWAQAHRDFKAAKIQYGFRGGFIRHGHTFLQLIDLRGYENLMFDMADEDPRLWRLIEMVEAFNTVLVKRQLAWGPDYFGFPEDLGMQVGPMLSPEHFRKYIKPSYNRMMGLVRQEGLPIHMHSDGDIRALVDDLIDSGVECINLQDLVNGVEWIRDNLKGRVCISLDIDRQKYIRFGTPKEIDDLVRYEIEQLGSPEGGLIMGADIYPGPPLENIAALMDAMERYATFYT